MIRGIIVGFFRILAFVLFRAEKHGEDNIPKDGPCILCSNHLTNWDAPILYSMTKRKVYIMAKEELFVNNFVKWLAKKVGVFPVKRGKQDIAAMKQSLTILNEGNVLGIFPEGTRKGLAKNGKLQNGVAFLSVKTGVPIIPVGIQGNFKLFKKIKVNYGKPLDYSQYKSKNPDKELLDKVSEELKESIINLVNGNLEKSKELN